MQIHKINPVVYFLILLRHQISAFNINILIWIPIITIAIIIILLFTSSTNHLSYFILYKITNQMRNSAAKKQCSWIFSTQLAQYCTQGSKSYRMINYTFQTFQTLCYDKHSMAPSAVICMRKSKGVYVKGKDLSGILNTYLHKYLSCGQNFTHSELCSFSWDVSFGGGVCGPPPNPFLHPMAVPMKRLHMSPCLWV